MLGYGWETKINIEKKEKAVYPELKLDLKGIYQRNNLPAVLKTIEFLNEKGWKIKNKHIYEGLAEYNETDRIKGTLANYWK